MSNFYEMTQQWLKNGFSKKFKTFENMNVLYIILKDVIYRFRVYNYLSKIIKFRDFMST